MRGGVRGDGRCAERQAGGAGPFSPRLSAAGGGEAAPLSVPPAAAAAELGLADASGGARLLVPPPGRCWERGGGEEEEGEPLPAVAPHRPLRAGAAGLSPRGSR